MKISVKQLAKANWKVIFSYDYNDKGAGFKTFGCDIEGITITHDRKIGSQRTIIYYTVAGRRTESPTQACAWYNSQHGGSKTRTGNQPVEAPCNK